MESVKKWRLWYQDRLTNLNPTFPLSPFELCRTVLVLVFSPIRREMVLELGDIQEGEWFG